MDILALLSDHRFSWSVKDGRTNLNRAQASTQAIAAQIACARLGASGLPDRALQALRQSELQVRKRSRSRSQVLPLGELPRQTSADGLRPSGRSRAGQPERRRLRPCSRHPGGDLRDQPRAFTPARAALGGNGEHHARNAHHHRRHSRWRDSSGQHARRLDRSRLHVHPTKAGEQR